MIAILDSIKLITPDTDDDTCREIAAKYGLPLPDALTQARERAAAIMWTAVPAHPPVSSDPDGKIDMVLCPACEADITDYSVGWHFCPYCGQALIVPLFVN